jgi:imidazolonepropionase-like amidohydrolase
VRWLPACLCAISALVAAPAPADTVLIRDARVHTMTSRGSLEADILLQDGIVKAIGGSLGAPAGAEVIEARGRPVTPGLFGGLTQLGVREIDFEPAAQDESLLIDALRPEFDVALAFNPASAALAVNAVEGVTFAHAAPVAAGSIIAGQGATIFLDGRDPAPGRALIVNLGGDANALSHGSRAAQFMLLRQALDEVTSPGSVLPDDRRLLTPAGRGALMGLLSGKGPIVFDVDRAADIRNAIALIRVRGLRGVIFGGVEAWRVAPELAAHGIPVILDPFAALPVSLDGVGTTLENAARLNRAGVRIAFSLRDEAAAQNNSRRLRQAAGNAVAHGLPYDAALAAITRVPAEIFGVAGQVGALEVGRPADLVLWSGDPLEVTTVAEKVFMAGRAHSMRSRQTELRDRYRPRRLGAVSATPATP